MQSEPWYSCGSGSIIDRRLMETVGEVIAALQKFDPDMPIMKSKDEEGNGFTQLWCIQREAYLIEDGRNRHSLEILNRSDIAAGEYEDDLIGEVVILW